MKRRSFLKLFSMVPLGLIIPKGIVDSLAIEPKPVPIKKPLIKNQSPLDSEGGYLVPRHIANEIIKQLHKNDPFRGCYGNGGVKIELK